MPLPLPTVHPRLLPTIARFYPQRLTIVENVATDQNSFGSPVEDWQPVAGMVDIPARVVTNGPGTGAGGWSGEIYAPDGTYDVEGHTAALMGYFPGILKTMKMIWDGETHEIQAVEHDAEGVTTRLRTRRVPRGGEG